MAKKNKKQTFTVHVDVKAYLMVEVEADSLEGALAAGALLAPEQLIKPSKKVDSVLDMEIEVTGAYK